jgi:subtilase family serine protease
MSIPAGLQGTATFSILNGGGGNASAFDYEIWLGAGDGGAGTRLARKTVAELARGTTENESVLVTIPAGTPAGLYTLSVVLDPDNQLAESNETNNRTVARSPVTVLPGGSDVNLQASQGALDVSNVVPDDTVTISYTLKNAGTDPIQATTKTFFYLSFDDRISSDDRKIGEQTVGPLASEEMQALVVQLPIPSHMAPGTYNLFIVADGANTLPETNEDDNIARVPLRVDAPSNLSGMDLVVSALRVTPMTVGRGGSVTVHFSIQNRGDTSIDTSFFARIYLAARAALDPMSDDAIGVANVTRLGAGESTSFDVPVTIPAGRAPGSYYIAVFVDPSNAIDEANEHNNIRVDTDPLVVTEPATSDLVAENVTVMGVDGGLITAGDPISVSFALGNNGPDASGSITANVVLSQDGTLSADNRLLGTVNAENLVRGETRTFSPMVTLPTDLDNRRYFLGVVVDPDMQVQDPNRANNVAFAQGGVVVSGGSGCTDDAFEPNDSSIQPAEIAPDVYDLALCPGNDDWFNIQVPLGSSLKVGITSPANGVDFDLELYAPGNTTLPIDASTSSGATEEVNAPFVTEAGGYLVRVFSASGSGPYRMTVAVTAAGGDGIDLVPLNLSFSPSHADPGQNVSVSFEARNVGSVDSPEFDYAIALVPASPTCTAEIALGTFFTATLPAAAGRTITQPAAIPAGSCLGDYNVKVTLDSGGQVTETYENNNTLITAETFTVGGINGCVDDSFEPNDTAAEARPISPGTYSNLKICPDDDDYYAVFLGPGEELQVGLSFVNANGDLDLQLLSVDGTVLDESAGTSDLEHVMYAATGNEKVVIRVTGFQGATNSYTLTVTGGASVDLAAASLGVAPLAASPGDPVEVTFAVANLLPSASPATTAEVRLQSGGASTVIQSIPVPALGAGTADGARKAFDVKFSLPSTGLAPGTYDLAVVVDPTNAIREATKDNNTVVLSGFRVAAACMPDAGEPNDSPG